MKRQEQREYGHTEVEAWSDTFRNPAGHTPLAGFKVCMVLQPLDFTHLGSTAMHLCCAKLSNVGSFWAVISNSCKAICLFSWYVDRSSTLAFFLSLLVWVWRLGLMLVCIFFHFKIQIFHWSQWLFPHCLSAQGLPQKHTQYAHSVVLYPFLIYTCAHVFMHTNPTYTLRPYSRSCFPHEITNYSNYSSSLSTVSFYGGWESQCWLFWTVSWLFTMRSRHTVNKEYMEMYFKIL